MRHLKVEDKAGQHLWNLYITSFMFCMINLIAEYLTTQKLYLCAGSSHMAMALQHLKPHSGIAVTGQN